MSDLSKKIFAGLLIVVAIWPSSNSQSTPVKNDNSFLLTKLCAEGVCASYFQLLSTEEKIVVDEKKEVKCTCNGTGKVLGPDKILILDCPAIETGTCKSLKKSDEPEAPSMEDKVADEIQVIALFNAGCGACDKFTNDFGKQLKDEGYGFDENNNSKIRIIYFNKNPTDFKKYASSTFGLYYVPQFVLVKNGKIIKRTTGYQHINQIKGLFNENSK